MDYLAHLLVLVAVYVLLSASLDLLVGHTGILSIAHAGFFGTGAYAAALCAQAWSGSFWLGLLIAVLSSVVLALFLMSPAFRLRGEEMVLATFAIQLVLNSVMLNWMDVTGGPLGLSVSSAAIPPGSPPGAGFIVLVVAPLLGLSWLVTSSLTSGSYGRALHAIREDELFPQTRGRDTFRYRREIICTSAGIAGAAGCLYAHIYGFVDPTGFMFGESILILSMVIIGGAGSRGGPILGALFVVLLTEGLRFVGLPSGVGANLRQIIYGGVLVLVLLTRPRGLVGRFGFGR